MYSIEVRSTFAEYWRYNVVIMAEGHNAAGAKEYVEGTNDSIAEVGSTLMAPPEGYPKQRLTQLFAAEAQSMHIIVYIVPHTMPQGNIISDYPPFEIEVEIKRGEKSIYTRSHPINQWSGSDVNIKI